ncbi:hypothetical protein V8C40DRAFT_241010 [Trichoderma camerunense]
MPAARTCFSPCIVCITIACTFSLAPLSCPLPGNGPCPSSSCAWERTAAACYAGEAKYLGLSDLASREKDRERSVIPWHEERFWGPFIG